MILGALLAAAAATSAPIVRPTEEACPIHHVILNVSYSCAEEFTVRGTRGYKIKVSADPEPGEGSVQLTAEGPEGGAEYIVPGKDTANTIRASFGKLGKIAVHFVPSGRERQLKIPSKCLKGRPPMVSSRLGRFVGTFEFRGERGYTRVKVHSAEGGIGDPLTNTPKKLQCESQVSKADREHELKSVALKASPPSGGVSFSVSRLSGDLPDLATSRKHLPPPGDRYLFLVLEVERVGRTRVIRDSGTIGDSQDFTFDESLTSATVTPPAPFSGTGTFVRNADGSKSWTGTLSAPVPGLGTVRLTGGESELATGAMFREQFEERLTRN